LLALALAMRAGGDGPAGRGVGRVGGRKFQVAGVWIIDRLNFHGTTIVTVSLGAAWPASLAAMRLRGCLPTSENPQP